MNYASCRNIVSPCVAFSDIFPICNSACICDVFESAAITERRITDRSYAISNCYARKTAAIIKRTFV